MLVIFLFTLFGSLSAEESLSFIKLKSLDGYLEKDSALQHLHRELSAFDHQMVQMRGFIIRGREDTFVLSHEPNLKTCCIGTRQKISQQIFLPKTASNWPTNETTLLQGFFIIDPQWDDKGNLIQLYRMEKVSLIPTSKWPINTIFILGICLGGVLLILKLLQQHKYAEEKKSG